MLKIWNWMKTAGATIFTKAKTFFSGDIGAKIKKIGLVVVAGVALFFSGLIIGYFHQPPLKVIPAGPVKTEKIYIPVASMPCDDCKKYLDCYFTGDPTLEIKQSGNKLTASAGLCERKWTRDFNITGAPDRKNLIGINYFYTYRLADRVFLSEYMGSYSRKILWNFYLTAGVKIAMFNKKMDSIGGTVGAAYAF